MSAREMLSKVVTLPLGGKNYKVTRLSVIAILRCAEDYVIDQQLRRSDAMINRRPEKDQDLLRAQAFNSLPSGLEIETLARELLSPKKTTVEMAIRLLHAGLVGEQPGLTVEDAGLIHGDATEDEAIAVFGAIRGNQPSPAQKTSRHSRRSTNGRRKS